MLVQENDHITSISLRKANNLILLSPGIKISMTILEFTSLFSINVHNCINVKKLKNEVLFICD